MLIRKIVIGVSGGPDSMYLLNRLNNNNKFEPIVVHVNYNLREESNKEQELVTNYCKDNEIELYIVNVTKELWDKYSYLGNKQSMARQIRFDKYIEIAKEHNTEDIFIAQHKDDFIETAIMQERKSDEYLFYGIKQLIEYNGYRIHRPLLNEWKKDIVKELEENNIPYMIDKSNLEPIYDRNKIRLELSDKSIEEKEIIYNRYIEINKSKEDIEKEVNNQYEILLNSEYDYETYTNIPDEYKKFVIYKWLIHNETRINISSTKIEAIIEFLSHKRGDKAFRLTENLFMSVKNSKIIIYT